MLQTQLGVLLCDSCDAYLSQSLRESLVWRHETSMKTHTVLGNPVLLRRRRHTPAANATQRPSSALMGGRLRRLRGVGSSVPVVLQRSNDLCPTRIAWLDRDARRTATQKVEMPSDYRMPAALH